MPFCPHNQFGIAPLVAASIALGIVLVGSCDPLRAQTATPAQSSPTVAADWFQHYLLTIDSDVRVETGQQQQNIVAKTDIQYEWRAAGSRRQLFLHWLRIRAENNGQPLMDAFQSGKSVVNRAGDQEQTVAYDDAPAELQKLMADSFGPPLVDVIVTSTGQESSRRVIAQPGAKSMVDNGIIENASLFHPSYFGSQQSWGVESRISMGGGNFVKGSLLYTPGATEGNLRRVAVSGTLTNDRAKMGESSVSVANAKYVVEGHQYYDLQAERWSHGNLKVDVRYQLMSNDRPAGSAAGVMKLAFRQVAADHQPAELSDDQSADGASSDDG